MPFHEESGYATSKAYDNCEHSLYVPKLKKALLDGNLYQAIKNEISTWADEEHKKKALEGITMLRQFDGNMAAESRSASIVGALLHAYAYNTFFDELGPEDSLSWLSFLDNSKVSYSAHMDHITARNDESPFWDDIHTPEKETKSQIIARSLADAITLLENQLGQDRTDWQWGKLHTYHWATEASKLAKHMGIIERIGIKLLSFYFNRGPFPADGDYTTLNVAGYHIAQDFDVWLIPEMRIIIDFGLKEPFFAMNSSGQSGNPASPHYDDGIYAWLNGNYQSLPFEQKNIKKQYDRVLVVYPKGD